MVPLLGISGFFFAITRNAMSTHIQSTTGDRRGRRNLCDNVSGRFGGVAPRDGVSVFFEWSCLKGILVILSNISVNPISALFEKIYVILPRNHRNIK